MLNLLYFRTGGSFVEGTGPSSLCSSSQRQHGALYILPQVERQNFFIYFENTFDVFVNREPFFFNIFPFFSFRWLLLGFQREFKHSDALRLFEILSCDHLELISQKVDRARYQERLDQKHCTGDTQGEKKDNFMV